MRRFVSQMAADLGLCEKLLQNDLLYSSQLSAISSDNRDNTGTGSSSVSVLGVYKCLLDVVAGSESLAFHAWLTPYRQYIEQNEQKLHSLLLPSLPLHKWYTPPLERNIRRERTEGINNVTTTPTSPIVTNSTSTMSAKISNRAVFAPEDELLFAEHLIINISACVGTRSVRLSNAAGTFYNFIFFCFSVVGFTFYWYFNVT